VGSAAGAGVVFGVVSSAAGWGGGATVGSAAGAGMLPAGAMVGVGWAGGIGGAAAGPGMLPGGAIVGAAAAGGGTWAVTPGTGTTTTGIGSIGIPSGSDWPFWANSPTTSSHFPAPNTARSPQGEPSGGRPPGKLDGGLSANRNVIKITFDNVCDVT
jgi:hypothetical protein